MIYRGKSCTISCTTSPTSLKTINNIPNKEKLENNGIKVDTTKDRLQLTKIRGGYIGKQIITRQALCRHFNVEAPSSYYVSEDMNTTMFQRYNLRNGRQVYQGSYLKSCFDKSIISSPPFHSYANGENSSKFQTRQKTRTRNFFNKSEGDNRSSIVYRFSPAPSLLCQDESKSSQSESRSRAKSSTTDSRPSIMQSSSDRKHPNCKYKVVFNSNRSIANEVPSGSNSNHETKSSVKNDNLQRIVMNLKYIDFSTET